MDALNSLMGGFSAALSPEALLWVFLGAALGTVIGLLPGLGPPGVIAILLPLSVTLSPTHGLIMMAGIFYGAKYSGSTTGILLNIPGDSNAVPAAIEGYPMALKGRAGPAMGITTIASFVAGTFAVIGLTFLAPAIADFALGFGPPETFTLMLLGLTAVILLAGKSMLKGLLSATAGFLFATVGMDISTGAPRFTYNQVNLLDGIDFIAITIGLYAIAEIFLNVEKKADRKIFKVPRRVRDFMPTLDDLRRSWAAILRGTGVGFFLGILPGAGATAAAFVSYSTEQRIAKNKDEFGKGAMNGLAAPEAANSASTGGSLIPLLTLGIPGSATTAVILGALILYGLEPGPLLFTEQPDLAWTIIASMYIGNVVLLVLNLPLIPVFASILRVPYYLLYPGIIAVSLVGVYSVNERMFDVWTALIFGVIGYAMRKLEIPAAPMVLAFVLGPLAESALRQAMVLSDGSLMIFGRSGFSITFLLIAALMLLSPVLGPLFRRLKQMVQVSRPAGN